MIKKILLTSALLAIMGSAFAAPTITFHDNTGNFEGKAAGIQGLGSLTKLTDSDYTIDTDSQGRTVNTTIQFLTGSVPPFTEAQGNLQWNSAGGNNSYAVSISAGALYTGDNKSMCYTMTVYVNGKEIGSNTTNASGKWAPTSVSNIALNDAAIDVDFDNKADCAN